MIRKVTDTIDYIGVNDNDIDLFESQYVVPDGITYNSYLIHDDKNTVMDTVDESKQEEWLANLKEALNGEEPDYLVISHMEPDHSASIKALADLYPNMKLVGNAKTFAMLPQFFDIDGLEERKVVVKEGESLNTGSHELTFYMAPMVHWPEVMVAYDTKDKALFSADAFGTFGTHFDGNWDDEARRYFINIVGKYGKPVQGLLAKAGKLDIEKILPLHGPVLDKDLAHYISLYDTWSSYKPETRGVLVVYASMHGNTKKAAVAFGEMLQNDYNVPEVVIMDLSREDKALAVANAFRYPVTVLFGASYDGGVFPPMEAFLNSLVRKMYQKRAVGIVQNGSWGPTAGKAMKDILAGCKDIEILEPMVTIKSRYTDANKEAYEQLAGNIEKYLEEMK